MLFSTFLLSVLPISRTVSPGRVELAWETSWRCSFAPIVLLFAPDVRHTTADEPIWFSGAYCRAFGPSEKGRVQKVAGMERRSAQRAHLQVQFCADRADFLLRMLATPQLTRLSVNEVHPTLTPKVENNIFYKCTLDYHWLSNDSAKWLDNQIIDTGFQLSVWLSNGLIIKHKRSIIKSINAPKKAW